MKIITKDITTIDDIMLMVDSFRLKLGGDIDLYKIYRKLLKCDVKLSKPVLYSFWNKIIFGKGRFSRKPFQYRIPIKIEEEHFEKFSLLYNSNVDELFIGKNAELVKNRIIALVSLYQTKLAYKKPLRIRRTKAELEKGKNDNNL
ncbi:MAG: hemoglobin [Planctomycetota bacterium]|jgi:hemoglobin